MPVPEATMNEDDSLASAEYEIGLPGQVFCMEPVAIAEAKDQPPYCHLRTRVFGADAGHDLGASGLRDHVHSCTAPLALLSAALDERLARLAITACVNQGRNLPNHSSAAHRASHKLVQTVQQVLC